MKNFFFLLFTTIVFGQNIPIDSVSYDYFYRKEMQQIVQLKKELKTHKNNALKEIALAELYKNINCEDSAYATFYRVFEKEKSRKTLNDEQYKELLFKLHETESSKHNYKRDRRFFLNELKKTTKNDTSDKWFAKIENENFKDIYGDSLDANWGLQKLNEIQKTNFYKTNAEFQSIILLGFGSVYTNLKQHDLSEDYLKKSLKLATQNKDYLRQTFALINLGVNERIRENYPKALDYLNKTDNIPNEKYRIKLARIITKQKQLVLEGLKDTLSAKKHELLFMKLDSLVDDFAKNSNFYEIDVKFQTKEKDAKINQLSGLENRFVRNKILYGTLIFLVFLLALYSFVRWKKVDYKKKMVEQEKFEILEETNQIKEELNTVKQLVTDDFIVLKNKSKVYLSELMYIKSEDHYLYLFTSNRKEFVRGKLSEILNQLPPNFVKCHRSYIINKNYIKQITSTAITMKNEEAIPISRNFKLEND